MTRDTSATSQASALVIIANVATALAPVVATFGVYLVSGLMIVVAVACAVWTLIVGLNAPTPARTRLVGASVLAAGSALAMLLWTWSASRAISTGEPQFACSSAVDSRTSELEFTINLTPPMLLCHPLGLWKSLPVSATPVATTVQWSIWLLLVLGVCAVSSYLCVRVLRTHRLAQETMTK